ncbi:hypothetical protein A4G26_19970 [Mycobacterium kansasii]|uniref:Uncharacterized protein n=1 Tax=Mycobacterium innocens TaxID=2341083 RepID=A0A498QNL2_9MYCO|nr:MULTISPECIES: hypothetical protein [Mycobacterium]KZS51729.1 hypothetical protein A4G26_19970 [Mycobacterium kansasii]VBA45812.1 hypothetical protein LAUMK13_05537 [Mycobacterium innocens]
MPIYMLNVGNQRAHIPAGPLSVSIAGSVHDAALDVQAGPAQAVRRSSAHHAVLPELTGPVTIAVRPASSTRFAAGTIVHLAIAHDIPHEVDPVQVLFDAIDVGGDSALIFAELRPHGHYIEVAVSAVADTPLSALAAAARTSARRVVGRDTAKTGAELVVALNGSASMRPWFADGSAAAATDVVVGVADALGIRNVAAVLVGDDVTEIRPGGEAISGPVPASGLADVVRQFAPRWSAGARWSRLRPEVVTVACSDFPAGVVPHGFAVITLSNDRRVGGPRLPAPPPGRDAANELLSDLELLGVITTGLVQALR